MLYFEKAASIEDLAKMNGHLYDTRNLTWPHSTTEGNVNLTDVFPPVFRRGEDI